MKPDLRIIKIDQTQHWRKDIVLKAGRIHSVYGFDANLGVHLCSLTPAYELKFIGYTWDNHVDDEVENEWLCEEILAAEADAELFAYYEKINLEKTEKWTVTDEEWQETLDDNDGNVDEARQSLLDEMIEHCQANGYTM